MPSPSRQQANPVQLLLLVVVALLTLTLWRQRMDTELMEREYQELERQKLELEQMKARATTAAVPTPGATIPALAASAQAPGQAQPAPVEPAATAPSPAEQAAKPAAAAENLVFTPKGMAPAPRESGLTLAGTHVAPIEGGLSATMQFNPATTDPLGLVAIVVRLPRNGESRILELAPVGSMKFKDVAARVSEDGKFAVFEGTPESVAAIEFALSVSGPAVADVRGTTGIGAFDLSVGPTGATATPK